jgi:hypothetical protein
VIRLWPLALVALGTGCTGEIQSDNLEGLPPAEQVARSAWVEKALPVFTSACNSCHGGSMPMVAYVAGADDLMRRDTLINYVPRIVNLGAPQSSRVLTKGDHTATGGGPALLSNQATDILTWILAEAKAHPVEAIRSPMFTPVMGMDNTIDLTPLGTAATLTFSIQQIGDAIYLTNLKLKAGADGLYFEHPLFETYPMGATDPKPDPVDTFFAVQQNLMPDQEILFGTGAATISGFVATDPMSIRFDVFEKKH